MLINFLTPHALRPCALQNNDIVLWREEAGSNDNKGVENGKKTETVQNVA